MNEKFSPENQALEINTLQQNYKSMQEQNGKEHLEIKSALLDLGAKIDKLEDKFAGKWTEKILIWLAITAGGSAIGLIIRWVVLLEIK